MDINPAGNTIARRVVVAALLAFMLIITLPTITRDTPTVDEPIHIYSGYTYLRTGNLSINVEHPPWLKELAALPLLLQDINPVRFPPERLHMQSDHAARFFYLAGNDPEALIVTGRLMMILVMLIGALILYAFTSKLYGTSAGLLALLLMAISPVFLAYGRLVTPDTACAATMLLTLLCYRRYLLSPEPRWLILCGLSLGLALMTQNTSFTLLLVLPILAIAHAIGSTRDGRGSAIKRHLYVCLGILVIAVLLIGLHYGVHTSRMTERQIDAAIDYNIPPGSLGYSFVSGLKKVSPPLAMYTTSVLRNYYFNRKTAGFLVYLNGRVKAGPFWYYYPEAFFLKTPLGVLALLMLALIFFPWRRMHFNDLFVVVPIAALMTFAATLRVQYGIKYLIPLYAFLYVFVARGVSRMLSLVLPGKRKMLAAGAVATLLVFSMFSLLSAFPHLIPYFNESIGSRDNGYRYLSEHNVDWGQDIESLASFAMSNGITRMQTALYEVGFYGTAGNTWRLLDYYLPDCEISHFAPDDDRLQKGWFALSTSFRKNIIFYSPELAAYVDSLQPRAMINHSILVYYNEVGWPP